MSGVQKLYKLMQKHKLGDKLSHRSPTARQCEEILSEMLNLSKKKKKKRKETGKKCCSGPLAFLGISTFRVGECCIDYKHDLNAKMCPKQKILNMTCSNKVILKA